MAVYLKKGRYANGDKRIWLNRPISSAPIFHPRYIIRSIANRSSENSDSNLVNTMQDIKPLLVFAAVLEHGSMNAAAAALGMTPSAVSQHINRLETLHGIKLLNIAIRGGDRALDDPNLVARHLVTWPYTICAAPDYLDRHPPITHPSQLHAHHWLHFLPVRTTLQHGGESYFLDITDSIACTHLAAVCSLTESGFGLSLQVGGEVREKIAQGRLKTVLPEWTLPPVSLYLVTPYRVQSAKTEAAVRIFTESFAKEADT